MILFKKKGILHTIKYKIYRFFHNLAKIWEYSCFLWNDYDWDYIYILKLLKIKLRRTRERIFKNALIGDYKKVVKQIKLAELLIDRIIEDDYSNGYYEEKVPIKGKIDTMVKYRHQQGLLDQDWNYLWNHIKKHMQTWWD